MAEQISATILMITPSGQLLPEPIPMSFPTREIRIAEVISGDINSSILYLGILYYASETKDALVTAANSGGGGGGVTIYTGDGAYPLNEARTIDQNGGSTAFINGNVGIGAAPTADQLFVVNDSVLGDLLVIDKTNDQYYLGKGAVRVVVNGTDEKINLTAVSGVAIGGNFYYNWKNIFEAVTPSLTHLISIQIDGVAYVIPAAINED